MAHFDMNRPAPFGALTVYRVVNFLDGLRMSYREWKTARSTDKTLRQLSDRELDDIGLYRGHIEQVSGTMSRR